MKRLKVVLAIFATLLATTATFAAPTGYAQVDFLDETCNGSASVNSSDFCANASEEENRTLVYGTNNLLYQIAQTIVYLVGAISVLMIIIGGFRYVISGGDANGTKGAKDTIMYALIGLIVAASAQVIVTFVLSRFK